MLPTTTGIVTCLLLCALLAGCISISHDSRYRSVTHADAGPAAADVVVGATTRAALIERLGSPDANWLAADGQEILRWDDDRERRTHVRMFPLLSVNLAHEDVIRYFFAVDNGVVVRHWHESASRG